VLFRLVLALLVLSTLNGLATTVLTGGESFRAAFPGATGAVFGLLVGSTGLGLVAVGGMWWWRRWGLGLFAASGVAIVVLDEIAFAPGTHQAAVIVSTLLVLALAWRVRDRFRSSATKPDGKTSRVEREPADGR
jgi:hypothetical protein